VRLANDGGRLGTRAATAFEQYAANYPQAETPQQKILLIDALIHAFHQGIYAGAPHKAAANNLIEGSYSQVLAFLDRLSYGEGGTPGLQQRRAEWQEKAGQAALVRNPRI